MCLVNTAEQCRLSHRSLAAPSCQQMSELEEAEVRLVDSIRLGLQVHPLTRASET